MASPSMGLGAWLKSDDTGQSSEFMSYKLAGGGSRKYAFPRDPDDLCRALRFLGAVPTCLPVGKMRDTGSEWAALVDAWSELMALVLSEVPGAPWNPEGKAPKTYARTCQEWPD